MTIHILLARQRSGTGAFGSLIDQHPAIRYLGEVFHTDGYDRPVNYFNFLLGKVSQDPRRALPDANERNYQEYMAHLREAVTDRPHVVIDVKYSSTHHFNGGWHSPFDQPRFMQFAKRDNICFVHLKRSNYIKTFVSGRLAELNKVWHATKEDKIAVTQVTVDKHALLNYLNSTNRTVNNFDGYLRKYPHVTEVEYGTLFNADGSVNHAELRKVATLIGLAGDAFDGLQPSFVKQTKDSLVDVITNYDEIFEFLGKTPFSGMLADDGA